MPAELLLLLIVAFASPSCQVLSSLRMGEALQPCPCLLRDPPVGPWAPLWEPRQAVSSGPRDPGLRSQLSSVPSYFFPGPGSLQPQIQESRPQFPSPLPPQDLRVWSPTPVSSQLRSWMIRRCVAVVSVWPWPWPGSRSTGSSRSQPRPEWKWTSLSCSGTASTRPQTPVSRASGVWGEAGLASSPQWVPRPPSLLSSPCPPLAPFAPSFMSALPVSQRWCCWGWGWRGHQAQSCPEGLI